MPYRPILALAALFLASPTAWAQAPFALGGPSFDRVNALALSAGATAVAGEFRDAFDIDPGPAQRILTSAGASDAYVAVYEPTGALRWAFALGASQTDVASGLAVGNGLVFVTGRVNGTIDFDPGPGSTVLETTNNTDDVFVAAYDLATGALRWATVIGTIGEYDEGRALAFDGQRLYTTGAIHGVADLDPRPDYELLLGTEYGQQDLYLAVFEADGTVVGGFTIASEGLVGGQFDSGFGIAVDSERIILTGSFSRLADFDPTFRKHFLYGSQAGFPSAFVAAYALDGAFLWAHEFNGGDFPDGGTAVALDAAGNVYAGGFFSDTIDFDPGPGEAVFTARVQDGYVVSFTGEGAFRWALPISSPAFENVNALAVAPEGHLYVGGSFAETVDFDPGVSTALVTATAYDDLFVASYTADGAYRWVFNAGDAPAPGYYPGNSTDALAAGFGYVVAAGAFDGTVDLVPGTVVGTLTTNGEKDGFVTQLDAGGGQVASGSRPEPTNGRLVLSAPVPNPTTGTARVVLAASGGARITVEVIDALGRRVARLHEGPVPPGTPLVLDADMRGLPAGLYTIRAVDAQGNTAVERLAVAR